MKPLGPATILERRAIELAVGGRGMSWQAPDGRGVEPPIARQRPRGRTLSDASCIRIRDMLASLLVSGLNLSLPDATRVLGLGAITERQLRNRVNECPVRPQDIMGRLAAEVAERQR